MVKFVNVIGWSCRPRHQRFFLNSLATGFIRADSVYFQALDHRIGHRSDAMVGVHTSGISCYFRESRHPSVAHLVCHVKKRIEYGFFLWLINKYAQGMYGTVSVPNPVISIERSPFVGMHLAIERTVIIAVLAQAYRTFKRAVHRSVEYLFFLVLSLNGYDT